MPDAASLPDYWNYNRNAMLNYIGECLTGIHGIVTDSATEEPLKAKIVVMEHDADSSHVYSDTINGDFHRLIAPGTYNILCSAAGYKDKTVNNVVVEDWLKPVRLHIEMVEGANPPELISKNTERIFKAWFVPNNKICFTSSESQAVSVLLYTVQGILIDSQILEAIPGQNSVLLNNNTLPNGLYFCKLVLNDGLAYTLQIHL